MNNLETPQLTTGKAILSAQLLRYHQALLMKTTGMAANGWNVGLGMGSDPHSAMKRIG